MLGEKIGKYIAYGSSWVRNQCARPCKSTAVGKCRDPAVRVAQTEVLGDQPRPGLRTAYMSLTRKRTTPTSRPRPGCADSVSWRWTGPTDEKKTDIGLKIIRERDGYHVVAGRGGKWWIELGTYQTLGAAQYAAAAYLVWRPPVRAS